MKCGEFCTASGHRDVESSIALILINEKALLLIAELRSGAAISILGYICEHGSNSLIWSRITWFVRRRAPMRDEPRT